MTATVKTMLYQLRKTAVDLTTAFSSSCNNQLQKSVFTVSAGYFAQIHPSFCVTKLWFVLTVNLGTQQFVVWSVVMIFLTPSHGLPCNVLKCLHFSAFLLDSFLCVTNRAHNFSLLSFTGHCFVGTCSYGYLQVNL